MLRWIYRRIAEPHVLENWVSEETTKYRAKTIGLAFAVCVLEIGAVKLEKVAWFKFQANDFIDPSALLLTLCFYMLINFHLGWYRDKTSFFYTNKKGTIDTIEDNFYKIVKGIEKHNDADPLSPAINGLCRELDKTSDYIKGLNQQLFKLGFVSQLYSTFWLNITPALFFNAAFFAWLLGPF
ncbi:hypothetical protein [Salinimonas chungwhensis]|uniref:hypothetical protein n=1 Tax=Salinimonas chungwhensis TaxID=265425 RepID=UPI00036B7F35|nr:hypothetical protein [Salinimonas chungwhensis]